MNNLSLYGVVFNSFLVSINWNIFSILLLINLRNEFSLIFNSIIICNISFNGNLNYLPNLFVFNIWLFIWNIFNTTLTFYNWLLSNRLSHDRLGNNLLGDNLLGNNLLSDKRLDSTLSIQRLGSKWSWTKSQRSLGESLNRCKRSVSLHGGKRSRSVSLGNKTLRRLTQGGKLATWWELALWWLVWARDVWLLSGFVAHYFYFIVSNRKN